MITGKELVLLILVGTIVSTITIGILGVSLITIAPIIDVFGIVTIGTWMVLEIHSKIVGSE